MSSLSEIFDRWKNEVLSGKPPVVYSVGPGFESVQIAPRRVVLIGAPPGSGKTALIMQWVFDALRLNSDLRAVVCNVEMPPEDLLDRELARVSGVWLNKIQERQFDAAVKEKIIRGMEAIATIGDRLVFVRQPFALDNVARVVDEHNAGLVVLDYIQRIRLQSEDTTSDPRQQTADVMTMTRNFAAAGLAVIVVSAVARDKTNGKAYNNLGLGSFRDSGELEFGADSAYVLEMDEKSADGAVTLRQCKGRYGARRDITCRFVGGYQQFVGGQNGC